MDDAKKDEPQNAKGDPLTPPAGAPSPTADALAESAPAEASGSGLDVRLIGLCVLLWVAAIGIFFSNWGDTKKDYYWGNIRQALDQPMGGYVDHESVAALVAMGEDAVPSCEHELKTQPDPLFKFAVVLVLQQIPGPKARTLLAWAAQQDPDARVRANALVYLRDRAAKYPDEKAGLAEVARERIQHEQEIAARAIAGVIAGQAGDSTPEVKSLLVHALQIAPVRKDAWTCLKALAPTIPPVDATREEDALKQVMTVEAWAEKTPLEGGGGIAIIGSKLEMKVVGGAPGAPADVAPTASPASTDAPAEPKQKVGK